VLKIIQPANTILTVELIELNLELYFSESPFDSLTAFSSVKPSKNILFAAEEQVREQIIQREEHQSMRDMLVVIVEHKEGVKPKTVESFTWVNPDIKLKT
jgi:hypothetical protein